jgi:peptidoglycan-N-acetylglucosamine deacetylase
MKPRVGPALVAGFLFTLVGLMALPHLLPLVLSRYRPDIQFAVTTDEKKLYLTIDDAPSGNTAEILRVLKKHDITATFFVTANRVKSSAQLDEIVAEGHLLGNHLKTTKACSKLSLAEFRADFDGCSALIEKNGKAQLFRPPSDFGTKDQMVYAQSRGYRAIAGTVFPLDHWISNPGWLVRIARWLTMRGGIVILHDGDVRGHITAEVLDQLLPQLKAGGYVFDRLDQAPSNPPTRR